MMHEPGLQCIVLKIAEEQVSFTAVIRLSGTVGAKSDGFTICNQSIENRLQVGLVAEACHPLQAQEIPVYIKPVTVPVALTGIGFKHAVIQPARLLCQVVQVCDLQVQFMIFVDVVPNVCIDIEGIKSAIGSPAIATFVMHICPVIQFADMPVNAVERSQKIPGTDRLFGIKRKWFISSRRFHLKVDQSAELRTELQAGGPFNHLNPLQGISRWSIIAFRVAQCIGTDVITILPYIEVGSTIRVQATATDTELQAGAVIFKNIQSRNFCVQLAGIII
ncbi:hypothetical protein D3C86_1442040 [compost metagenome]